MQESRIDYPMKQKRFFYGAKCIKQPGPEGLDEREWGQWLRFAASDSLYKYDGARSGFGGE